MARPDVLVNTLVAQSSEPSVVKALRLLLISNSMCGLYRLYLCSDLKSYIKYIALLISVMLIVTIAALFYLVLTAQIKLLHKAPVLAICISHFVLIAAIFVSSKKTMRFCVEIDEISYLFDQRTANSNIIRLQNYVKITIVIATWLFVGNISIFVLQTGSSLLTFSLLNLLYVCGAVEGYIVTLMYCPVRHFLNSIRDGMQSLEKEIIFFVSSSETRFSMQLRKLQMLYIKTALLSKHYFKAFQLCHRLLTACVVNNCSIISVTTILKTVDAGEQRFKTSDVLTTISTLSSVIFVLWPMCHLQSRITEEASLIKQNLITLRCRHHLNKEERRILNDFIKILTENDLKTALFNIVMLDRSLPWKIMAHLVYGCILLLQFYKLYIL